MLRQAKAEHSGAGSTRETSTTDLNVPSEPASAPETRRNSTQTNRLAPQGNSWKAPGPKVAFTSGSADDDDGTAYGSYEASFMGDLTKVPSNTVNQLDADGDDDEEYGDGSSDREAPASKDAFEITAQSAKLQLDMMGQVNAALQSEQSKNPTLSISDPVAIQAVQTYDSSIRNLKGLVGDLLKISKDRDAYWQYRLDREADMRRMWEDSMAQVAREQEILEARVGESEEKRKLTKRVLREVIQSTSRPESRGEGSKAQEFTEALEQVSLNNDGTALRRMSTAACSIRRKSLLAEVGPLSESDSEAEDEFFDAIDAGEVEVAPLPLPSKPSRDAEKAALVKAGGLDLSPSFRGYENGIRLKLAMDADDRPKISLWVCEIF
jgi:hypothetical protein